ncbi:hypothetical protein Fmac_018324 [Flemingia macrophylla]|uniref:Uncharacterized protein n=1 Tax=Flemingia macrophylla TaxID=520843 RepID=A0ABD1M4N2_9FABA
MAEEKAMPPRSSFSICLSIFSFSREGSKATLVLVCPIFFFSNIPFRSFEPRQSGDQYGKPKPRVQQSSL